MELQQWYGKATAEQLNRRVPVTIESRGFSPAETVEITADTLFAASEQFGAIQKDLVAEELSSLLQPLSAEQRNALYADVSFQLKRIDELSKRKLGEVNGVDYLSRYMEVLDGFAKGAGISREDAAVLQSEILAGCQTMIVQDKQSGSLGFIHTEENASDEKLANGEYRYKMVRMKTKDSTVRFLAYPGLAGWGAAFGVNETTGMVQLVDDLVLRSDMGLGDVWANAIAFMTLDAGKIDTINALLNNFSHADPPVVFTGGYAIHTIEQAKHPRFQSIEFAGESIHTVPPEETKDKTLVVQVNTPRDVIHGKDAQYRVPTANEAWDSDRAQLGIEMERRMKRLRTWGKHEHGLVSKDPKAVLRTGLRVLAMPDGDIEDVDGKRTVTGLANEYVAGHVVGYVGEKGIDCVFGKRTPPPIIGKEYSFQTKQNGWARTELKHIATVKKIEHSVKKKISSVLH